MTAETYPLRVLLLTLAGWINVQQQHVVEYLVVPAALAVVQEFEDRER